MPLVHASGLCILFNTEITDTCMDNLATLFEVFIPLSRKYDCEDQARCLSKMSCYPSNWILCLQHLVIL